MAGCFDARKPVPPAGRGQTTLPQDAGDVWQDGGRPGSQELEKKAGRR